MDYDPTACINNLNAKGLTPPCGSLNPPWHCEDVINEDPALHTTCADAQQYLWPVQCVQCYNPTTQQSQYFPPSTFFPQCAALGSPWQPAYCYCCCSCFANDTLIAVPAGFVPIYTIPVGSSVLTSTLNPRGTGVTLDWSETSVSFSQGTGSGGHQPMMVYITFGAQSDHDLICSSDQPFLLADGKFTTGGKLRPGQQLVDRDGQPQEIQLVSVGAYEGGVHHIATSEPWRRSPDGHLILAGGVVVGDYTLQMRFSFLDASLKEADHDNLPLVGTAEYDQVHGDSVQRGEALFEFVQTGGAGPQTVKRQMTSGTFKTYRQGDSDVPFGAQALLTPDQAADIATNGSQAPLSNPIPRALFRSVMTQLTGFYPDIVFYYDQLDPMPNVYAFEAYGKKIVQVSGGLARMQNFNYEGLFMAMAHGVACFYGGDPKNSFGYSAVGQADWYAFGVISRLCWLNTPGLSYIMAAMSQWQALFALVNPDHAGGDPQDPLNNPSLTCRIQTIQSAAAGGALPECAGGAPEPKIELEQATFSAPGTVTLTFSLAVESNSASDTANYSFSPAVNVTSAKLDANTGFIVHLEAKVEAGTTYEITIGNLTSILGTGVDPAHASTQLTVPTSA